MDSHAPARQKIIYYTALNRFDAQNPRLVEALSKRAQFRGFEFVPLCSEREINRVARRAGRAAMVWGAGTNHHFSFYFDVRDKRMRMCKVNIDRHNDFFGSNALRREPDCGNHMLATMKCHRNYSRFALIGYVPTEDDLQGIVPYPELPWSKVPLVDPLTCGLEGLEFHITVDFDVLSPQDNFPAEDDYRNVGSVRYDDYLLQVRALRERKEFHRLDVGGLGPYAFSDETLKASESVRAQFEFVVGCYAETLRLHFE